MKKLLLAVGARPNFMKMAPLYSVLAREHSFNPVIVHTGQHYDYEMSKAFFEDLKLPRPHHHLDAGSGTHAVQTAKIMVEFEKVIDAETPDLVVVFGDVNSTVACSITAKKCRVRVAHVEAGLRSFDDSMPEEINRKVTDSISDLLFTHSEDADRNLVNEGVSRKKIHRVGNIMIDSICTVAGSIDSARGDKILQHFGVTNGNYSLITLHRPCNVDRKERLAQTLDILRRIAKKCTVLFPMHPRTRKNIEEFGIEITDDERLRIMGPLTYREFIVLEKNARFVLTDSGGIQEETTFFHVPCLTLRPNTERPVTIEKGTNELIDIDSAEEMVVRVLDGKWKKGEIPELWDGGAAERITEILRET